MCRYSMMRAMEADEEGEEERFHPVCRCSKRAIEADEGGEEVRFHPDRS